MINPTEFLSRTGYREVSAGAAAILNPGATINGVLFTGASNIVVDAAAGTLTGDTLASNVLNSSLTLLGTSAALPGSPTTTTQSAGDNSTKIATTAFVTSAVASGIIGVFTFKGVIDASGNPNYPAAAIGDTYKISVAGKIGGASGVSVAVNDTVYCSVNNSGGTQAAVGADFVIIEGETAGEVIGPASSIDTDIALFNGTTGQLIKDSGIAVSGSTITASITGNAGTVTNGIYTTSTGVITGAMMSGTGAARDFGITITGGTSVVATGAATASITIPFTGTITKWYLSADQSGSIVIDVKRSGTSIIGTGNKPTLSSQQTNNAAVSGWTSTAVTAGDVFTFDVNSAATVTSATLVVSLNIT